MSANRPHSLRFVTRSPLACLVCRGGSLFGKLGHGDENPCNVPKPVAFFHGKQVAQVACGRLVVRRLDLVVRPGVSRLTSCASPGAARTSYSLHPEPHRFCVTR